MKVGDILVPKEGIKHNDWKYDRLFVIAEMDRPHGYFLIMWRPRNGGWSTGLYSQELVRPDSAWRVMP